MLKSFRAGIFGFIVLGCCAAWSFPQSDVLTDILGKLRGYTNLWPGEKIYLHLDKPLYAAGEDIWFAAYLFHASTHRMDSVSRVLYVELYSPEKKLIQQRILYSPKGAAQGDFHLADSLPRGNYVIRAYTNYMKSSKEDFFFTKEIPVLSSISTEPSSVSQVKSLSLQFFPESGNLVEGVENRVAFKASGSDGLGVDVQGNLEDETGKALGALKSEHLGMGMIRLTPMPGKKYQARLTSGEVFPLPAADQQGYLLRIMEMNANVRVIAYRKPGTPSVSNTIYLVAQMRGINCFATPAKIGDASAIVNIPKRLLPTGIIQITLFDENKIPQCERLFFSNHGEVLKIDLHSDKAEYAKRGKVNLDIDVQSETADHTAGQFSLSVYDEIVKDPHEYPSSVVDNLLLTSDLKGYIQEPAYYLKDTLPTTKYHLDLLMMTQGWRRFTWKNVLNENWSTHVLPERGIAVSGKVTSTFSKKPSINSRLKIINTAGDLIVLKTDSSGNFRYDDFVFYDSLQFSIQTDNAKGKKADLGFYLNKFNDIPSMNYQSSPFPLVDGFAFLSQNEIRNKLIEGYKMGKDAIMLSDVVIRAEREKDNGIVKLYGMPDATVEIKDPTKYSSVIQTLQGQVAGVMITGAPGNESVSIRGQRSFGQAESGGEPMYLLDGIQVNDSFVKTLPVSVVDYIDVIKNAASLSMYGSQGANGVIAVYTKKGAVIPWQSSGMHHFTLKGFYKAREFYSPAYDGKEFQNLQDVRNTLYWNPSVKVDSTGRARVSFFTSDIASEYKVVIEGISKDGTPGVGSFKIKVH
jgi:TonB-dependent Receptor Plug Domain